MLDLAGGPAKTLASQLTDEPGHPVLAPLGREAIQSTRRWPCMIAHYQATPYAHRTAQIPENPADALHHFQLLSAAAETGHPARSKYLRAVRDAPRTPTGFV